MRTFIDDTVTLSLNTGIDLTEFTELKIKYRRPDGVRGSWDAEIDPSDNMALDVYLGGKITVNGLWFVQAYVANGLSRYHGDIARFFAFNPLADN